MTNPEIIAIVISIGGLIVAALAYRRAGRLKKLDLLVEAGRAQNGLQGGFESMKAMHDVALDHRRNVMSALGSLKSGNMQRMQDEWNADAETIVALESDVANSGRSPNSMSPNKLAALLVEIDAVKRKVDSLGSKYKEWDEWDEQQRLQIREEKLAQFQAGRTSSPT